MSDYRIGRTRSGDWLNHWITLEGEGQSSDVIKIEFFELPFSDQAFIEKITKALMEEVREQFIAWREDKNYDRNPTYFDRKSAERVAIKIIEDMKGGFDGL